ncbi:hypothetical protein GI374_14130 [Paracoccus sp. S-4012]|uniref:hypothetical protein n=1 Tax=Paracoccus sp. S-4012 TaxID=2665648 RepID=UPI0012B15E59|nr:hypothetical protein [Paracoccus sp. S-4012]MRX51557.1 hypothetical protein [Paracoccus sp. S-4012]
MIPAALLAGGLALLEATPAAQTVAERAAVNDYPTEARAEYVFACMAANGNSRKALTECACTIDHIATVLPYEGYVAAETVLRMRQTTGERATVFRDTTFANEFVDHLRLAAAEAEILCFTPGN